VQGRSRTLAQQSRGYNDTAGCTPPGGPIDPWDTDPVLPSPSLSIQEHVGARPGIPLKDCCLASGWTVAQLCRRWLDGTRSLHTNNEAQSKVRKPRTDAVSFGCLREQELAWSQQRSTEMEAAHPAGRLRRVAQGRVAAGQVWRRRPGRVAGAGPWPYQERAVRRVPIARELNWLLAQGCRGLGPEARLADVLRSALVKAGLEHRLPMRYQDLEYSFRRRCSTGACR
jgi:hypothetical protein